MKQNILLLTTTERPTKRATVRTSERASDQTELPTDLPKERPRATSMWTWSRGWTCTKQQQQQQKKKSVQKQIPTLRCCLCRRRRRRRRSSPYKALSGKRPYRPIERLCEKVQHVAQNFCGFLATPPKTKVFLVYFFFTSSFISFVFVIDFTLVLVLGPAHHFLTFTAHWVHFGSMM